VEAVIDIKLDFQQRPLAHTGGSDKNKVGVNLTSRSTSLIIPNANGGDRLRQGFGRPTDAMPGYSMQLVKKRREKTIANNNELALAA